MKSVMKKTILAVIFSAFLFGSCVQVDVPRARQQQGPLSSERVTITANKAYLEIGYISLEMFDRDMAVIKQSGRKHIILKVNSGGGSVVDMWGILDRIKSLKNKGYQIDSQSTAMIASAAVPIFLMGEHRVLAPHCVVMLHPHSLWTKDIHDYIYSDKEKAELDESPTQKSLFEKMSNLWSIEYAEFIADRTDLSYEEALKYVTTMDTSSGQYWFTAYEAIQMGFADGFLK